jgi:GTP-binding protein
LFRRRCGQHRERRGGDEHDGEGKQMPGTHTILSSLEGADVGAARQREPPDYRRGHKHASNRPRPSIRHPGQSHMKTDPSAPHMQQASPNPLRGAAFVLAAHRPDQLPADAGVEVALPDGRRLIDLPGYGYAKVPAALRDHWRQAIDAYLRTRTCLRGLVLISDIRHALAAFDRQMLAFCATSGLPCVVLLSKADKLSRAQARTRQREVDRAVAEEGWRAQTIAFSATTGGGVAEARAAVAELLD